jgi:acetolactate synthase-1/2/3 large subunit
MFFNENYFASQFISNPDFTALAMCFGIKGHRLTDDDSEKQIRSILAREGPALIEVPVNPAYNVLPIVPPGSPHYTMIGGEADDAPGTYCK